MKYVYFFCLCLFWGSSFILMKRATTSFGPLTISGLRVAGGAISLFLLFKFSKAVWTLKNRKSLITICALAVTGNIIPFCIQPYLISMHSSAYIGMVVSLVPFITIALSIPLLKQWPTAQQLLGVVGGFCCMFLLFSAGLNQNISIAHLLIAGIVPLSYAVTNTLIKKHLSEEPTLQVSIFMLSFSCLMTLPLGLSQESIQQTANFPVALASVLLLGTLCTGVSTFIFYKIIRDEGPLFAGMVTYVIPLVAMIWGWLDAEPISNRQLIAMAGILLSVLLVQTQLNFRRNPKSVTDTVS